MLWNVFMLYHYIHIFRGPTRIPDLDGTISQLLTVSIKKATI